MKQGDIWLADLNPIKGKEQAGMRPVVIISGNMLNSNLSLVIICPLTSKVKHFFGGLVIEPTPENGLQYQSEVLTFHIRAVSKERLNKKLGSLNIQEMQVIKNNLDDLLSL